MTFEELWVEVEKLNILPDTAIQQIPYILKKDTKRKLQRKSPADVLGIIEAAIDEVNRGSVEDMDSLIRRRL